MRPKLDYKRKRNHFVEAEIVIENAPRMTTVEFERDLMVGLMITPDFNASQRRELSKPPMANIWVGTYAEYAQVLAAMYSFYNYSPAFFRTVVRGWSLETVRGESFFEYLDKSFRWYMELKIDTTIIEYSAKFNVLKLKVSFPGRGADADTSDFVLFDLSRDNFSKFVYDYNVDDLGTIDDWEFGELKFTADDVPKYATPGLSSNVAEIRLTNLTLSYYDESKIYQILKEGLRK